MEEAGVLEPVTSVKNTISQPSALLSPASCPHPPCHRPPCNPVQNGKYCRDFPLQIVHISTTDNTESSI